MRDLGLIEAELEDCLRDIAEHYEEYAKVYLGKADVARSLVPLVKDTENTATIEVANRLMRENTDDTMVSSLHVAELRMKYARLLHEFAIVKYGRLR